MRSLKTSGLDLWVKDFGSRNQACRVEGFRGVPGVVWRVWGFRASGVGSERPEIAGRRWGSLRSALIGKNSKSQSLLKHLKQRPREALKKAPHLCSSDG